MRVEPYGGSARVRAQGERDALGDAVKSLVDGVQISRLSIKIGGLSTLFTRSAVLLRLRSV